MSYEPPNRTQLDSLRAWNLADHLQKNRPHYAAIIDSIHRTMAHVSLPPPDSAKVEEILKEILRGDPILGKYLTSRQYVYGANRLTLVGLFAKLAVAQFVESPGMEF